MLRRFLPRQENFFQQFQKIADLLVNTATEFQNMMHDLQNQQIHVQTIQQLEEEADKLAHRTFQLLHKTFITPFDRHDIHKLTSGLDDISDQINSCAQRFPFYDLKQVPPEITRLAELGLQSCLALKEMIYRLNSLNKSEDIFAYAQQIDNLEGEAHQLVLSGEKNLYLHENHFKQFLKLKEIYSRTKLVVDAIQDAGNIIKGIVLEYS